MTLVRREYVCQCGHREVVWESDLRQRQEIAQKLAARPCWRCKRKPQRTPTQLDALAELTRTSLGIACFEEHGVPIRAVGDVLNARDGMPS